MSEETSAEEVEEKEQPTISTGNSDIDGKLGGGIPVGSLTLIEGPSASGKSVLTQQFTSGSLGANTTSWCIPRRERSALT